MDDSEHAAPALGESAKSLAEQARAEGRRLIDAAKADLLQAAESRKAAAGSYLADLSSALRKGSEDLRGKGRQDVAGFGDIAAEELDRLGAHLDENGISELVRDFEDFARRRPEIVFGAALLAGFGATRFVLSSQRQAPERPPYRPPRQHRPSPYERMPSREE